MNAKKCDRCGNFYMNQSTKVTIRDDDIPGYFEEYDLCGSCLNMLRAFLKDPDKTPIKENDIKRAVLIGLDKSGLLHGDEFIDPVIDEIKDVYIDNSFGRYDIPY